MTTTLPFAFSNNPLLQILTESVTFEQLNSDDTIISICDDQIKVVNASPIITKDNLTIDSNSKLITLGKLNSKKVFIHFHNQPINQEQQSDWFNLRALAMNLPMDISSVVAQASSLSHWHTHHQYCGLCSSPTQLGREHSRVCSSDDCNRTQFPRIDPAVIMSVINENDEILLGRQASWDANRFSVVAGFLSHGESLEECVAREVLEETGVVIDSVDYIASQPWPFPSSIMLGFRATAKKQPIITEDDELEEAFWISREELQAKRDRKEMFISPRLSISRYLIDLWIQDK
jgi:NAD+ diphosphatase